MAESTDLQRYGALGNSPVDIFKSFLTQPGLVLQISLEPARRDYVLGLLAAFGFFSLLAPEILLLCLPVLLANSLSAFPAQYYSQFHYDAPDCALCGSQRPLWCGPAVALCRPAHHRILGQLPAPPRGQPGQDGADGLHPQRRCVRAPLLALGLVSLGWSLAWAGGVYAQSGRGPLGGNLDPTPVTAHHQLIDRFTAQIPPDAAVSATAAVHPHVSHRQHIYQFPKGLNAPANPATWALIDVTTNTDLPPGDVKFTVDALLAADWGIVDAADGFLLMAKDAPAKTIPDAFYDFARRRDNAQCDNATMHNGWPSAPSPPRASRSKIGPAGGRPKSPPFGTSADDYVPGSVRPLAGDPHPRRRDRLRLRPSRHPRSSAICPDRWRPAGRNRPPHRPCSALPFPHLGRRR